MTANQLREWRQRLDITQPTAAERLGLSLRGYQNLERGFRRIRHHIALACTAIDLGVSDYSARRRESAE